jgi:opacity protein-like surface antigen
MILAGSSAAWAGPPYLTDDPEPTELGHYEIYAFGSGVAGSGEGGIDLNYGGAPNLQLSVVAPVAYDSQSHAGLANISLGAKYRFLQEDDVGFDVSVYPALTLSTVSPAVGDRHTSLFLPVWAQKNMGEWSVFGGGGCTLNRSRDSHDFCQGGVAVTRKFTDSLNLGAELFYQGTEESGKKASVAMGAGMTYDLSEHYHLLAYWGPQLKNVNETGQENWYGAILFTF